MSVSIGDVIDVHGVPSKVVAFRDKVKGPTFTIRPGKYIVFVEQTGAYRLGTVRADSV